MYDKSNIMSIIADHQKEIDVLELAIKDNAKLPTVKYALATRLSYLQDNKRRYELQAKAWKLID